MAVASKGSVMVVKDLVEVNLGLARAAFLVSPVAPTGEVLRAVLVAVGELALFAAAVEPAVLGGDEGATVVADAFAEINPVMVVSCVSQHTHRERVAGKR